MHHKFDYRLPSQAMDILDNEASEDEAARKEIPMSRPLSHEANCELVAKQQRYRSILLEAAQSDDAVRQKWEDSEAAIANLTLDEVRGRPLARPWRD